MKECEKSGCKWKGSKKFSVMKCKCSMPDKIEIPEKLRTDTQQTSLLESGVHAGSLRVGKSLDDQHASAGLDLARVSDLALARDDPKLAVLEMQDLGHAHPVTGDFAHLTREQKHNRAMYNLHTAGAFEDQNAFLEEHLFTGASAQKIFTGAVSYLQLSARAHESATARAAAKALGLIKLPNRCVNAESIGKTITLAINYENPNLFKCMMAIPFVMSECMPELLIAITPITIEGNNIAPECLAGSVAREKAKKATAAQLDKDAVASIEREVMENVPKGNGVGKALREAR